MAIIDDVINYLQGRITFYNAKKEINVTMRIDETLGILKTALDVATDAQGDQKFDLTQSITGQATITYKVGNTTINAGSNVLTYGDELKITVEPATGYEITSFKINNQNAVSGTTITVTDNLTVAVVAELKTFDLTASVGANLSATYTVGGDEVEIGTDALTYGDELTITLAADEGYQIATFTVNDVSKTSPATVTVTGDVAVVATAEAIPAPDTPE